MNPASIWALSSPQSPQRNRVATLLWIILTAAASVSACFALRMSRLFLRLSSVYGIVFTGLNKCDFRIKFLHLYRESANRKRAAGVHYIVADGPPSGDLERPESQHSALRALRERACLRSPASAGRRDRQKASCARSRDGADLAPMTRPSSSVSSNAKVRPIPRSLLKTNSPRHRPGEPNVCWRGYDSLIDLSYGYFQVNHSRDEFTRLRTHKVMYQIMCQPRKGVLPMVRQPPLKGAPRCHRLRRSRTYRRLSRS